MVRGGYGRGGGGGGRQRYEGPESHRQDFEPPPQQQKHHYRRRFPPQQRDNQQILTPDLTSVLAKETNAMVEQGVMDPNQTYIMSGPYVRYEPRSQSYMSVFTAKPVPSGMTVIATPVQPGAPATSSSILQTLSATAAGSSSKFNPNATPFVPRQTHNSGGEEAKAAAATATDDTSSEIALHSSEPKKSPCFMYWSTSCPEGTLLPLRQPQPPVYFETVK